MTLNQLTDRINYWRKHLAPLGLMHYNLKVAWNEAPFDQEDACASILVEEDYDRMRLEASRSWFESHTRAEQDEVIIHELLHVVLRGVDLSVDMLEEHVQEAPFAMWEKMYIHYMESAVRRMATTIQMLSE